MDHDKATFEKLIQQDRATRDVREWRGTLLDYLEKIRQEPGLTKLAHARMHDVIVKVGVRDINETEDARAKRLFKDESVKVYSFFADEFFGIEKVVAQLSEKGVQFKGSVVRDQGGNFINFEDPDGNEIYLWETNPASLPETDLALSGKP